MLSQNECWLENIAADLAKQGFAIQDNFLSDIEVLEILKAFEIHEDENNFKRAGIGKSDQLLVDKSVRGDLIKWIDPANCLPQVKLYLNKVDDLVAYLNRTCYLGIKDCETHFTIYPEGTYYERHLDQFKDKGSRQISFICYLNNNWSESQGGQLRLYTENGSLDVWPHAGRLACFVSSEIEHEVIKCHRERYSLTGWMLNQKKSLDFLP